MPDSRHLPVDPASARALAAARPGERVVLRVKFAEQPPEYIVRWEPLDDVGPPYWCGIDENGDWQVSRMAPAALGERVKVECPECGSRGFVPCEGPDGEPEGAVTMCPVCEGHGEWAATLAADPRPEPWCDGCRGELAVRDRELDRPCEECGGEMLLDGQECEACGGEGILPTEEVVTCPTCRGTPPWYWRVEVRKGT